MSIRQEFDQWANTGRDRGMEERHWHTAKYALSRMPIERGDTILDLGTGSGYALRALRETQDIGSSFGLDGSPEMVQNAREYTEDPSLCFINGDFHQLPFADEAVDHVWSMEAFYYSQDPLQTLSEIRRVLRSGGTFFCAVNFFDESQHTHNWQDRIGVNMQLWNQTQYREKFREAGLYIAEQDTIPDNETEIPPADDFPTESWESREAMIDRYRTWGTLLTVGIAP
ncbi:class I SAM-dependent methyltransferase [Haloquadratum walsbyi]|jgi:Methylase involved in ubiquinone/menaquinone biosynthesis|uniref:Methylase involved in ubiquinone/menaquinone biosynthesis n=1 Tax=Haloquadratum walsbyi J07HQW2 TaxID=1238425 RepID=U1MZI4_9EURY|nr:class I SAM-dependent methyltransferase [Haloquadratum walsbyi]ERG95914.1 MAG: methylase involved in ubiquinone/menaquinone biosynthesis [Haloquadratum walsbyi J07HQW2]